MHGRFMFCSDDRLSASEPAAFYFLFTTKRMDIPLRVLSYFTFGRQSKKLTLSLSRTNTLTTLISVNYLKPRNKGACLHNSLGLDHNNIH